MTGSERLRQALATATRPAEPPTPAMTAARYVAACGGGHVAAIVFFGSQKTRARPDPWSAHDFFVVTRRDAPFYRALASHTVLQRRPGLLAALGRVLPPNVLSIQVPQSDGGTLHAKCAVLTTDVFRRETSRGRRDHFCSGRLFQPTEILYTDGSESHALILDGLASVHAFTYDWVRPWLPDAFDVDAYCRTALQVSLSWEIRPEPSGRAQALWEAQASSLRPVYAVLLEDLAGAGELERAGEAYRLARPATGAERRRVSRYFRLSLVRATARWAKYMVTFTGWLDYILRKARRHTGEEIVLTPRERRWPLLFLWPRVFRYLRHKR